MVDENKETENGSIGFTLKDLVSELNNEYEIPKRKKDERKEDENNTCGGCGAEITGSPVFCPYCGVEFE